jgi:hypothetical protein
MDGETQHAGRRENWFSQAVDPGRNLDALRESARRAVEAFADRLETSGDPMAPQPDPATDQEFARLIGLAREDLARFGELGLSLLDHGLAALAQLVSRTPARPDGSDSAMFLTLRAHPGGHDQGIFWVHNTAAEPVSSARPHCGPLRSHQGEVLDPDVVSFDPVMLDPLPGRSTCGIEVHVRPPHTTSPGTYASVILVSRLPDAGIPIRVRVLELDQAPG